MFDNASRVLEVSIDDILPNRFQPRIQFEEEEILELSDSIKEHGVIQPIVVRTIGDKYEIIAGERRYKASVLAGKTTIPVIVRNLNDKDSAEIALIENVQRKDLTPIEEALSYKNILDMGYMTQENLAEKLGRSQSTVANKIRLLNLSDEVQEALLENKISERHARSLLKLKSNEEQNKMLNRIITERLTVRKTDEEIEKLKNGDESSDDSSSDSQKIIEKGEYDMNNNLGIPTASQPNQNLNMYGGVASAPAQPAAPVVDMPAIQAMAAPTASAPAQPAMEGIQFDANGNVIAAPTSEITPEPVASPIEIPSVQPVTAPTIDIPVTQPVTPVMDIPTIQPMVSSAIEVPQAQPAMNGIQFDANGNVIAAPSVTDEDSENAGGSNLTAPVMDVPAIQPLPEVATQPVTSPVPELSPIVEQPQLEPVQPVEPVVPATEMTQQTEDLFSFGDNPVTGDASAQPETAMPEPIIITDYTKQYDPVMPQPIENTVPKVEFKEVVNAIRECSAKIEQYGFKIDVEEYDLANLYQVVLKVEK